MCIPAAAPGLFFTKGYRFDAGATLAGGFAPGGPHTRVGEWLGLEWPVQTVNPAWVVQVGGERITQWADPEHWRAERQQKLPGSEPFWQKQEQLAEISWRISSKAFPWPPVTLKNWLDLVFALRPWFLPAVPYVFSSVASLYPKTANSMLRSFVDAQLLISAQTTAEKSGALYGSAALDLPRRGVNQVRGGMGGIAKTLADWITANGGNILYRQKVEKIEIRYGKAIGLSTQKGLMMEFDQLIANLTPWGLADLLVTNASPGLNNEITSRAHGWGAFMLYLGVRARWYAEMLPTISRLWWILKPRLEREIRCFFPLQTGKT